MNTLHTSSYKTRIIGFILIVSGFICLIKSDNNFYTLSNLPSCREQAENSLNIPGVPKNNFTFSQSEISANLVSDVPIILNHSHFDTFKTYTLISYNSCVSVKLKSIFLCAIVLLGMVSLLRHPDRGPDGLLALDGESIHSHRHCCPQSLNVRNDCGRQQCNRDARGTRIGITLSAHELHDRFHDARRITTPEVRLPVFFSSVPPE